MGNAWGSARVPGGACSCPGRTARCVFWSRIIGTGSEGSSCSLIAHQVSHGSRFPGSVKALRPPGRNASSICTMAGASEACSRRERAAFTTSRCRSMSFGAPRVLPMGFLVRTVRGSLMAWATWRNARTTMVTVEIPASSTALATCPTDTWHTGQTGTMRTASTSASRIFSTHSGRTSCRRSWLTAPGKE